MTPPPPQDHFEKEVEEEYEDGVEPKVETPDRGEGLSPILSEVVQHVLAFLSGLAGTRDNPTMSASQISGGYLVITTTPIMD